MTGLPNRSLILDRTEQMLARARRSPAPVAALFIDLDGFKDINDTLGHSIGDQVLREVADRLAGAMRASDSVGRLGGDEFVVLVDGCNAATAPEMVADRLLSILRAPFEIEGVASPLTVTGQHRDRHRIATLGHRTAPGRGHCPVPGQVTREGTVLSGLPASRRRPT